MENVVDKNSLPFEKPILDLAYKIDELRKFSSLEGIDVSDEIKSLEDKALKIKKDIFKNLSAWQRIQIARHPNRPYFLDYANLISSDFIEIHGDRAFADDQALLGGFATIGDQKVMLIGHQKGRDIKENMMRNFGCAHPEGYRKALRLMRLANKFNRPIITCIDTPGAYPGIEAEERGQAEAIAVNLREMMQFEVPIIVVVIGEGGSGGALGIGIGNKVLILENSYYSVISPEGCAAILWKTGEKTPDAAEALCLTANDLKKHNIIDDIVAEPLGGAHKDPKIMGENLKKSILENLSLLNKLSKKELLDQRYKRFRDIGYFEELKVAQLKKIKNAPAKKEKETDKDESNES